MNRTTATGHPGNMFVNKNAGGGVAGTKITAEDMNAHQEEIYQAIVGASLTPDAGTLTQLRDAIRNTAVPVGYIYTQLPGMAAPATLWPWATWANESATFAGAFFRAEGGKASAFGGGVQNDAFQGHWHRTYRDIASPDGNILAGTTSNNDIGGQTDQVQAREAVTDGVNGTPRVADETRPTNYTVRIWRRTA